MSEACTVSKELEDKKRELSAALKRLEETKLKALNQLRQIPIKCVDKASISSVRHRVFTRPTASSRLHSSKKCINCILGEDTIQCKVNKLDRYSLSACHTQSSELGSGSFGKCTKMILCSTEVAVKETTLEAYSRDDIMYEAMVMTKVCCGHPNLPLFMGIYDHVEYPKPLLITKLYSIAGESCTLHDYLQKQRSSHSLSVCDWARVLIGICNGLEAIHNKGYLHNDIKSNNIVFSDCMPSSKLTPSVRVWPIIIDFGKARPVTAPKRYKLLKVEQDEHLKAYPHLAPDLVRGTCSQSILSDVYSLGHVIRKVALITSNECLKSIAKLCMKENVGNRPSIGFVRTDLCGLASLP